MLPRVFLSFVAVTAAFLGAGCTGPVEPPPLSRRTPVPVERLALGPEFDRVAVRRIVDALGEGLGDPEVTKDLQNAVDAFYDEKLAGFRDELARSLLDEADDRNGLLALVERRLDAKDTVELVRDWRRKLARAPWKPLFEGFLDVAAGTKTAPVAERALGLLDPEWTRALPPFSTERDDALPKLFEEVASGLGDEGVRRSLFEALQRTVGGAALPALFEATAAGFVDGDGEAFAFAQALARATESRYEAEGRPAVSGLEGLLRLFATLDQPTEGLFATAAQAFADDPALRNLAMQLVRVEVAAAVGRTSTRAVAEDLGAEFVLRVATEADLDGSGFQELFGRMLDGFQQILGPVPAEADAHYGTMAVERFPVCYAIARWYQAGLRAAAKDLKALPEAEFREAFLAKKIAFDTNTVVFGKAAPGQPPTIDPDFEKALGPGKLQLGSALPALRAAVQGRLLPISVTLPKLPGATLETAMDAAVKAWDRTRPLADAQPTLRTLFDDLSRGSRGWIGSFDGPNLWNGLHLALRSLPAEQLPRVRKLLFEDLRLQSLSPNARELVGKLVEKTPKAEVLVTATLRDLGAFAAFAAPVSGREGGPQEALAFYRRLTASLPEKAIDVPGRWFRVARGLDLGSAAAQKARPTMHRWLASPERVVRVARWVADAAQEEPWALLAPLAALFPKKLAEGWDETFRVLATVAKPLGEVATELVDREGAFHGALPLVAAERGWIARKARAGAWIGAGAPALQWLRTGDGARLLPLFRRWAEDGTWGRLFEHLQWVRDPRLARWARALRRAEALGFLREALREPVLADLPPSRSARP